MLMESTRNKIKPITPEELSTYQLEEFIPDFVIQGVNNAIKKYSFGEKKFDIKQSLIIDEIMKVSSEGFQKNELFEKHYLDFEQLFRKHGWVICYDKPAYNESYQAFFTFTIK